MPEQGGFGVGRGGGLVVVGSKAIWNVGGGCLYRLEGNDHWIKLSDHVIETGARLGVYRGKLAVAGGRENGIRSKKIKVMKDGQWILLPDMLVGCAGHSIVSDGAGGLIVLGGVSDNGDKPIELKDVQVFDGVSQAWHVGPSLPQPCRSMSAVVFDDIVYIMGGKKMNHSVWCANVKELVSNIVL